VVTNPLDALRYGLKTFPKLKNPRPGGLMARRCFPVLLIGKDCGFESRPGRSFALLGVSLVFAIFREC
jgi:hypothetical protein